MNVFFGYFLIQFVIYSASALGNTSMPIDLPPADAESALYAHLPSAPFAEGTSDSLAQVKSAGTRNLKFFDHLNSLREDKLVLSPRDKIIAFPIEAPLYYSETLIVQEFAELLEQLPARLRTIILASESTAFPDNLPLPEETYLEWARKLEALNARAIRWTMLSAYLPVYTRAAHKDIRGYYYLSREEQLETRLNAWHELPSAIQDQFFSWLAGMCFNSWNKTQKACVAELTSAISSRTVLAFFQHYLPTSKIAFDSVFNLYSEWRRPDAQWQDLPVSQLTIPVVHLEVPATEMLFATSMNEVWSINEWTVDLEFRPKATTSVEFSPGAQPHAQMGAYAKVVLNSELPLNDYAAKFVIGHEFGHVMGFPDCYVEFYDQDVKAMVNYQIDTNDLMCSRKGVVQPRHYEALKASYK